MKKFCKCDKLDLYNQMRMLWSQHVYWTRFFIISTVEGLADLKYVTDRLLENPQDFADAFEGFYGKKNADTLKALLTEHLQIGGELVNADKDMNTAKADELRKKWYRNADDIARFLSEINPDWSRQMWQKMMYGHLSMTEKETALRIKKEYPKDIQMFNAIEKEALEMGNYMAKGIFMQLCCR